MNREQALEVAKQNHAAHSKASIAEMFKGGPAVDEKAYGYKHGWYAVGEFNFSGDEVTGTQYDYNQGGWAYL